jgi:hypothetical protein
MNLKKNAIKYPFIHGVIIGYLIASFFDFPAPPPIFWVSFFACTIVWCLFSYVEYKFNDDIKDGDF